MPVLNKVSKRLPRQWLQSVLLHVALLICAVLYHLYHPGYLHFSANSLGQTGTSAKTILSNHNSDFLELSFEKYEMTDSQPTDAKPADEPTDVLTDALIEEPTDVLIDALIDEPIDSLIDVPLEVQIQTPIESLIAAPMTLPKKVSSGSAIPTKKHTTTEVVTVKATESVVPQSLQTARPDHALSPKPDYPLALRDLGVSGVVWLRVWVDHTGRPKEIELAKGSGYRLFDEAALRAVQHWRFIPAKNGQQSLASWVEFAVRFELNS